MIVKIPGVIKTAGIYSDQLELIKENTKRIAKAFNKNIPAFCAFHIPSEEFQKAEINSGYINESRDFYTIGVDVVQKNGDFGFKMEEFSGFKTDDNFVEVLKECNIEAVFVGHCHSINTCISYDGIRWVFGLKTGQYDYHVPGQLGGTLICLEDSDFEVTHIPSLVPYAPLPRAPKMFKNFFAEDKYILENNK